jgi:hypothetical protein
MYALDGIQVPSYLGTGCMFRRLALYGIDPPRWRPDDILVDSSKFGKALFSSQFLPQIPLCKKEIPHHIKMSANA